MKFPKLRFTLVLIAMLSANLTFAGEIERGRVTIDLPAFREMQRSPELREAMKERMDVELSKVNPKSPADLARLGFTSEAEFNKFKAAVNELHQVEKAIDEKPGERAKNEARRAEILAEHYNKYSRVLRDADIASYDAKTGRFQSEILKKVAEPNGASKALYRQALASIAAGEQGARAFGNAHEVAAGVSPGLGEALNAHRWTVTNSGGSAGKEVLESVATGLEHLKAATSPEGLRAGDVVAKLSTEKKEGQPSEKENVEQIFNTLLLIGAEAKDFKAVDENLSLADANERQDINRGYAKVARMTEEEMRKDAINELKKLQGDKFSETGKDGKPKSTAELMMELPEKERKEVMEKARKAYEEKITKLLKERLPVEEQVHMACGAKDGSGSCLPDKLTGASALKQTVAAKQPISGKAGLCAALYASGNAATKAAIMAVLTATATTGAVSALPSAHAGQTPVVTGNGGGAATHSGKKKSSQQ